MCKTMNELEKMVADYRGLKALKEQVEEELKAVEREIIGYSSYHAFVFPNLSRFLPEVQL